MKTIQRSSDVVCGSQMEDLGGFKSFPVYMGCVAHPQEDDLHADMFWHISTENGLIQLKDLIPLDILYPENHAGAVGKIWMRHHDAFAQFISTYSPKSVLEIGGAHGILSKLYHQICNTVNWSIIEPNPIPVEGVKAKIIKGFFDDKFNLDTPVDAIVHSHVFEHVYDPNLFLRHIASFLAQDKYLIFSLPNMKQMLRNKYTNCINFEHTVFLTEPYIEYMLKKHGFRVLERKYFMEDHSIFYACKRDGSISPADLPSGLYEENKQIYLDYVSYHESLILTLNSKIKQLRADQTLFVFGAHVFAQYLIGFGLDTGSVKCLLDNDPNKQGKRLYGTSLKVESPAILATIDSPVVILKAGVYNDEIKRDILDNINSNVVFWE